MSDPAMSTRGLNWSAQVFHCECEYVKLHSGVPYMMIITERMLQIDMRIYLESINVTKRSVFQNQVTYVLPDLAKEVCL